VTTGTELRLARIAQKLTIEETARRAGMGVSTLSRLENERIALSAPMEARLKTVLGWNETLERLCHDLAAQQEREQGADLEEEEVGDETGQEAASAAAGDGQQPAEAHLGEQTE
jgi:transcriptional regulator with XRE-family HTH domain